MNEILSELSRIARLIASTGITKSPFGGNYSIRVEGGVVIKRSGASVLDPREEDLILVPWGERVEGASVELVTHIRIYERTDAGAIFHLHTPAAVALSLLDECSGGCRFIPPDVEGRLFLGAVEVVEVEKPVGSEELAEALGTALERHPAAIVRGHGTFAVGSTLTEAFARVAETEFSSEVALRLAHLGKRGFVERA